MEMLTGNGCPSKRLVGEIGQHYKDLDTGDIYECKFAEEHSPMHGELIGGYVWKKVATGDLLEVCAGSSDSGSGGALVVTFTVTGSGSDSDGDIFTNPACDKTSAEIVEAYNAGIPVVGYLTGASGGVRVVHLTNVDNSLLTFVGMCTSFNDRGGAFDKSLSAILLIRMSSNGVDAARTYDLFS